MVDFFRDIKFFLIGPFPNGYLGGIAINVLIAILTIVSGFILGVLLALGRISDKFLIRNVCKFLIEVFRALPLVLIVFWLYFIVPILAGKPMPILLSAYISITLYSAVNQAEIIRTGFINIEIEQWEAAKCTGLSRFQCIFYVILPQTLRIMLPSLVGFFVSLFKDTSVISIIGIVDLTYAGLILSQREPNKLFFSYIVMSGMYFLLCVCMSRIARIIENKQQLKCN